VRLLLDRERLRALEVNPEARRSIGR
jgi:hypothetical protein